MAITVESTLFTQSSDQNQAWSAMAESVRAALEREFRDGLPPGVDLEEISRTAVSDLQDVRIKAFVPVLALRAAREALARAEM